MSSPDVAMDTASGDAGFKAPEPPINVEKQQEAMLKSKYGNLKPKGGSALLKKRLAKGGNKYFDSGDYNMAKNKTKGPAVPNPLAKKTPTPVPIQIPDELPQAVRRQSNAVEIQPQNVAALQQRRGSQSTLANVSH